MKNIEIVLENLTSAGLKLDSAQANFLHLFDLLHPSFAAKSFFARPSPAKGTYLWGPVGRGKTMLLDSIQKVYFPNAGVFHYIEFMQDIHKSLQHMSSISNPLIQISKDLSKKYKVIFIDEFQVEDIADAMIVGTILQECIKRDTKLMLSSNADPDSLYKNGLQRIKFLPTIDCIHKNFEVMHLDGAEDYRLKEVSRYDSLNSDQCSDASINFFLAHTFSANSQQQKTFIVNGREFSCNDYTSQYLWISFRRFFGQPSGSVDFIAITKNFDWVFISDFYECGDENMDSIRRFISFIDIAYQENKKMKLFMTPEELHSLYTGDQLKTLWDRAYSRLQQIYSNKYLQNLKKN